MAIAKNSVVSLHYEMYDANNQLLDKTEEPIAYLHGGYDGIFPLVEEALHGKDLRRYGRCGSFRPTMRSASRIRSWSVLKMRARSLLKSKSA